MRKNVSHVMGWLDPAARWHLFAVCMQGFPQWAYSIIAIITKASQFLDMSQHQCLFLIVIVIVSSLFMFIVKRFKPYHCHRLNAGTSLS